MPSDPRDYKLDLSTGPSQPEPASENQSAKPFISVHFACCGVYTRIYRNPTDSEYRGRCPKCGKSVRFVVAEGGTTARTFVVT
jgi:hypothetical protein